MSKMAQTSYLSCTHQEVESISPHFESELPGGLAFVNSIWLSDSAPFLPCVIFGWLPCTSEFPRERAWASLLEDEACGAMLSPPAPRTHESAHPGHTKLPDGHRPK